MTIKRERYGGYYVINVTVGWDFFETMQMNFKGQRII